jgi:hypothetical protein
VWVQGRRFIVEADMMADLFLAYRDYLPPPSPDAPTVNLWCQGGHDNWTMRWCVPSDGTGIDWVELTQRVWIRHLQATVGGPWEDWRDMIGWPGMPESLNPLERLSDLDRSEIGLFTWWVTA